jgi:CHAT domain-containing protein
MIFLNNQVGTAVDQGAIDAVQTQLTQREADYEELLTKIKLQSPEVAGLVSVDIAKLTEIQNLLDPNTTLVDYFVTEDRTLAFLITHSSFETVALQVHAEDLNEAINTFRDDFAGLTNVHPSSLKQLYTWLILPLKDKLNTRLVGIIPHGTLHYVPFAALTDGEHYLSEEYALFTLPSASVLRFIQEKRKPTAATILAVGNPSTTEPGLPPLQSAEKEAQTIASLFGAQPLIGDSATESALRTQSPNAGIVHIAAHGKYNSSNPLFSTLFLAKDSEQDGRLQVQEIYSLDLTKTTDLVVLSACETQVGDVSAGDEVVGMTRAFLYAGTPTVIASLWKVDDEATTLLMERFYNHLREGMGKAQALQQAQRELREQYQQYRHPYYWAAFVLTGDPGEVVETNPAQPPTNARRIPPMAGMVGVLCLCLLSLLVVAPGIGVLVKKRWRQSA